MIFFYLVFVVLLGCVMVCSCYLISKWVIIIRLWLVKFCINFGKWVGFIVVIFLGVGVMKFLDICVIGLFLILLLLRVSIIILLMILYRCFIVFKLFFVLMGWRMFIIFIGLMFFIDIGFNLGSIWFFNIFICLFVVVFFIFESFNWNYLFVIILKV